MTTKKYDIDQLYAICDHLNAANTIAMGLHISKDIFDLDQLSDMADTIAAVAETHGTEQINPYFSEVVKCK